MNLNSGKTGTIEIALLTGGGDRPYVFGLATALMSHGPGLDLIGSDEVDCPEFHGNPAVTFLNLRGSHRPDVSWASKASRVLRYYIRLIRYAAIARPRIFHILWNNKCELFDRTLLMLYYRLLGKKLILTAHNVNARKRDSDDTRLNRASLKIQYRLADHIFVHTDKMKQELRHEFGVQEGSITVIPFGINNSVPNTGLTTADARQKLGIPDSARTILFFGNITPYKGVDYLITAFRRLLATGGEYRLVIAGRPNTREQYWAGIQEAAYEDVQAGRILLHADFIPDDETEVYFKAADVLVLPYRHVYQSGVLFLGYSFGLPVLAADVGSLRDEIVEGETGFVFLPEDPTELVKAIERYFASDLYANLYDRRRVIQSHAMARNSWDIVAEMTRSVYGRVLAG